MGALNLASPLLHRGLAGISALTIVETAQRQWYIKPWQMVRLSS
jgi:hypothetical protein